jgi:hypothetical protein
MKYIIDESKLIDLLETYHYANCLDQDGVDNWNWYMIGKDSYLNGKFNTFRERAIAELKNYPKLEE